MKSRMLSPEQVAASERHQTRLAERDTYAGHHTIAEAAKLVSVTPNAIEQAIHSGRLDATKISYPAPWGSWRITLDALRACWPDLERIKPGRPRKSTRYEAITQDEAQHLFDPDVIIGRLDPDARNASLARMTDRSPS